MRFFAKFEKYFVNTRQTMRKILLTTVLALLVVAPSVDAANKKKKKFEKNEVVIEQPVVEQPKEQNVTIVNPAKQLYGEWTIETVRKKQLSTSERAYIYLDFNNKQFYGSNGCNTINGKFKLSGNNISFKDIIATHESCHNHNDRNLLKTLTEVVRLQVTSLYNVERMQLLNSKGNVLITLKRHNLDLLNGAWQVKNVDNEDVKEQNIKLVIDVNMLKIHANTGCNIINGIVTLDPSKDFAIQFEDLHSWGNDCENIESETNVLLALECTECYKRINNNEIALMTLDGKTVMTITRLNLKQ